MKCVFRAQWQMNCICAHNSIPQCSEEIGRTYPRFAAQEACAGPDLQEMLDGPRLFSRTLRSVTQRFALFSPALQRGTQFL
jgi:hypothetical protein